MVTGVPALVAGRIPTVERVFPAAASFLVAMLASFAGSLWGTVSVSIATLAGLVVLLPGLMLVSALGELSTGHLPAGTARAAVWIALLVAALAFSVLLRADRRDIPWIILAAIVAIIASDYGSRLVGSEMGPFFGSFGVAVAGWVFQRRTLRPAMVVAGIDTAFGAILTAIALVVGLLIANVVLPARRDA